MSSDDDRLREGIEHLQGAVLELIAAARVALDLAEHAVREPRELVTKAAAAAEVAKAAMSRVGGGAPTGGGSGQRADRQGDEPGQPDHPHQRDHPHHERGIERIRVV